mgnify:FL=1
MPMFNLRCELRNCLRATILLAALALAPWSSAQLDADAAPKLGTVISAEQEAGLDLIASAEGGLPAGSGSAFQGRELYAAQCAACHGADGKGGAANQALVGGSMQSAESPLRTVGSYWPHATTLFDFIRRAMPANAPKTLSDTEVYQLVAYILYMNGLVDQYKIIDADSLPSIRMPNAEGFVDASGAH